MTLIIGSLQLGCIYGLLAIGVYIAFRILDIPDLSAEGTFTFGLAVSAALTAKGLPLLGIPMGFFAGCLGGAITGFFQTKLRIHPILAGILTMSGLYSVNLAIMGSSSNISLVGLDTLFRMVFALFPGVDKEILKLVLALLFCAVTAAILAFFFKTHIGLCIRAAGDNEDMVRASSINVDTTKILALSIGNGCIGLSGALLAQYQGFADISSGIGIVAVGLASVIIGERLFGQRGVTWGLAVTIAGSVAYRLIIALALKTNLFPAYFLKIVSAVIVAAALAVPAIKEMLARRKIKKEGLRNAVYPWSL